MINAWRIAKTIRFILALASVALALSPGSAAAQACPPDVTDTVTIYGFESNSGVCNITGASGPPIIGSPGGQLIIDTSGHFANLDTLNNAGSIVNGGAISNEATGILNNNASILNNGNLSNAKTLNNSGVLTNSVGATLSNDAGTLSNSGTLENRGTLSNSVTLDNNFGASITNDTGAKITNNGTINNIGGISSGGVLNGTGTLNNSGGLAVTEGGNVNIANSANLVSGTLSGGGWRVDSGFFDTATTLSVGTGNIYTIATDTRVSLAGPKASFAQLNALTTNDGILSIYNRDLVLQPDFVNNGQLHSDSSNVTISVQSGNTATNNGGIFNSGTLSNKGTLHSNGDILNNNGLSNAGTLNNNSTLQNNGQIANSGSFTIASTGRVTGTGSYTQTAGLTDVKGDLTQSSFDCQGGAVKGTANIQAPNISTSSGCITAPGNTPGTLTLTGDVVFDGQLDIEIAGLANFDVLKVIGGIHFGDDAKVRFVFEGYTPQQGDRFTFLDADFFEDFDKVHFSFDGLATGYEFQVRDAGNFNIEILTTLTPGAGGGGGTAPEPGTLLLMTLGLGWFVRSRNRRGALLA